MLTIVTGRYNNETWEASRRCRVNKILTCIYAPPFKLTDSIPVGSTVAVIEMNNSINQIIGIGLIKNKLVKDKVYKVQEDTNCNRFIYIGEHYISREQLGEFNEFLVYVLEEILFKGYTHSKRGSGLTKIPQKVMTLDVCEGINIEKEIRKAFVHFYKDSILKKE
jgi:hypothetical protein